ncbi:hypothetical protein E4T42_01429 [Aureobasidium subglaciale]|nr:hypothetical protein E4T42_01429 [Aureobasidium subglaciale]
MLSKFLLAVALVALFGNSVTAIPLTSPAAIQDLPNENREYAVSADQTSASTVRDHTKILDLSNFHAQVDLAKQDPEIQDRENQDPEEGDPPPHHNRSWCKKHPNHPYCDSQFCRDHPGSCKVDVEFSVRAEHNGPWTPDPTDLGPDYKVSDTVGCQHNIQVADHMDPLQLQQLHSRTGQAAADPPVNNPEIIQNATVVERWAVCLDAAIQYDMIPRPGYCSDDCFTHPEKSECACPKSPIPIPSDLLDKLRRHPPNKDPPPTDKKDSPPTAKSDLDEHATTPAE